MTMRWSPRERATLLLLAREAVVAAVRKEPPPPAIGHAVFDQRAGAFVTLKCAGDLRGCIGQIEPQRLADVVVHCAGAAALDDPRFPPVTAAELTRLRIELSVLGPMTALFDPATVETGRHGLVIKLAGRQGLLLPRSRPSGAGRARSFSGRRA